MRRQAVAITSGDVMRAMIIGGHRRGDDVALQGLWGFGSVKTSACRVQSVSQRAAAPVRANENN